MNPLTLVLAWSGSSAVVLATGLLSDNGWWAMALFAGISLTLFITVMRAHK